MNRKRETPLQAAWRWVRWGRPWWLCWGRERKWKRAFALLLASLAGCAHRPETVAQVPREEIPCDQHNCGKAPSWTR